MSNLNEPQTFPALIPNNRPEDILKDLGELVEKVKEFERSNNIEFVWCELTSSPAGRGTTNYYMTCSTYQR